MRYLNFTAVLPIKRYYELCLQGVGATTRELNAKREGRTYDKLCTKLEEVGVKGELLEDKVVALEDAEFDLMVECLDNVKWTNAGVREAYKMMEWIREAPTKPTLTSE